MTAVRNGPKSSPVRFCSLVFMVVIRSGFGKTNGFSFFYETERASGFKLSLGTKDQEGMDSLFMRNGFP
jgi:hypothetical protein